MVPRSGSCAVTVRIPRFTPVFSGTVTWYEVYNKQTQKQDKKWQWKISIVLKSRKCIHTLSSTFLSVPGRKLVCCRWYPERRRSRCPVSLPLPGWTKTQKHLWRKYPTFHGPVPLSQDKFDLQFHKYHWHVNPQKLKCWHQSKYFFFFFFYFFYSFFLCHFFG